jgi:hypothetical protein
LQRTAQARAKVLKSYIGDFNSVSQWPLGLQGFIFIKKTPMAIKNIQGLSTDEINRELAHGAKFVIYDYTISIIVMTFRRSSEVYFVRAADSAVMKGLPFTLLSLFFGWWGIPWGPIYTIGSLYKNLRGGKDVTNEILASVNQAPVQA